MELVSTYIVRNYLSKPYSYKSKFRILTKIEYQFFSFTVQKMLNFQNLQNLASLQQQKLSFVGLAGLSSASTCLNSPLNLSLSSSSHTDPSQMNANCSTSIASELAKNLCGATAENYSPQMPQLILASVRLWIIFLLTIVYNNLIRYFNLNDISILQ